MAENYRTKLQNLAVAFRTNSADLGHVSTFETVQRAGCLFLYWMFRGTPERFTARRRKLRNQIAEHLEAKAKALES